MNILGEIILGKCPDRLPGRVAHAGVCTGLQGIPHLWYFSSHRDICWPVEGFWYFLLAQLVSI